VIFKSEESKELFETFSIYTEDYRIQVPISVFPPSPFFVFKPFLDFGFVEIDKKVTKSITIKNEGLKAGEISFQI